MRGNLTKKMEVTLGTRGNFRYVLSLRFLASFSLIARCQGRPKAPHFWR